MILPFLHIKLKQAIVGIEFQEYRRDCRGKGMINKEILDMRDKYYHQLQMMKVGI